MKKKTEAEAVAVKTGGPIGMTHPSLGNPKRISFGTIKVSPERFQGRNLRAASYVQRIIKEQESRALIASLTKQIEAGAVVDPLIVWQDAEGQPWVIDGHHRMEALAEAGTKAKAMVYVQYFAGTEEAQARAFAAGVLKREHLNMLPSEALDNYWRMLLCGETSGSVRGRAKHHHISQSTVQRMDAKKAETLLKLQQDAGGQGVSLDVSFIRVNAPAWKELAEWRNGTEEKKGDGTNRKAIEGLLRTLTTRFSNHAKAQPYVLIDAIKEFLEEATGREVDISFANVNEDTDGETSDF